MNSESSNKMRLGIRRVYRRFWSSDGAVFAATSALVGLGAGLGAILFRWLTLFFNDVFFVGGEDTLSFLGRYYVIFVPAAGGLVAGCLIHFLSPNARGFGLPEVIEAVALNKGRIRPLYSFVKVTTASICIGTGGSVGIVGPIMQLGSGLGSYLGQTLRLSDDKVRVLVACGAAGGIATTFNAPIAGVFFALEGILREFSSRSFAMVVIASVVASEVGRLYFGDFPAFQVLPHSLESPWELLLYGVLGVAAALTGTAFTSVLYRTEDLFNKLRLPAYVKPAVGGLGVGLIGLMAPEVFGVGFETIERTLLGEIGPFILLGLLGAKMLATSLSLSSGGSGGLFAPILFLGAVLGGSFGHLVNDLAPSHTGLSGAYALVGMAGLIAGTAKSPMAAVLIIFEMTRDYQLILPLMFTAVVSYLLAGHVNRESIYTQKLARRGIKLSTEPDSEILGTIRAANAMTPLSDLRIVKPETSFDALAELFQETHSHGFAVLDENRVFLGIVALSDLERAMAKGQTTGTVRDITTSNLITAHADESLEELVQKMGQGDVSRIPVVGTSPTELLGMVHRADVIRAYTRRHN